MNTYTNTLFTNNEVKFIFADRVISRFDTGTPASSTIWLKNVQKFYIIVELHTQEETDLQKYALQRTDTWKRNLYSYYTARSTFIIKLNIHVILLY